LLLRASRGEPPAARFLRRNRRQRAAIDVVARSARDVRAIPSMDPARFRALRRRRDFAY